ncbi:GYF domain-containing protein [Luteolibacter arcticus]|uniref:GYF domain-containing protein n=1 Tax=Luteolibacter arcticus TaxID=1581411 RepID=A0ABT3GE60_9BACT|nr:GYF domain-containing protein [Luteolibacter arcticus]MCW1921558.1 GYF domain-containing protein [Luteolibacter arcticus]
MNWFYAKNGSQQGPLSTEDMKSRIAMGEIGPNDLGWCEGMSDWLPVGQIPQLKIEAPVREEGPPPSVFGGAPSPYQAPSSPAGSPTPAQMIPGQPPSQGLAIGSMVCGILAFLGCCVWYLAGPLALVAVVLGHIAISKVKANPAANGGKGMARTGLILGYLGLLGAAVFAALTIWASTLSPQETEDMILKWIPEAQRQEFREKFEAEKAKQQQR